MLKLRGLYRMLKRRKSSYLLMFLFAFILYGLLTVVRPRIFPIEINLNQRDMLEQHKCPACFGENLCNDVYVGAIKLTNWTRYTISKLMNARNVFHGVFKGYTKVIIKKLGHDKDLEMLDNTICKLSEKIPYYCNPAHYIKFLTALYTIEKEAVHRKENYGKSNVRRPELTKTLSIKIVDHVRSQIQPGNDFLGCTSTQNLLDYIIKTANLYQLSHGQPMMLENILSILIINPEPLVLTAFPAEEGWPVPKFYGSCGRLAVMEDVGNPLSSVVNEPFTKRARMALQVLKIASQFTRNDPNLALYLTDWSMDNFAVDTTGTVRVIDLEHTVLVNRSQIREIAAPGWDVQHSSSSILNEDDLNSEPQFSYSLQDLCTHEISDLNLFGACQWILSTPSPKYGKSLLHDVSDVQDKYPLMPKLIRECSHPSRLVPGAREEAVDTLIDILSQI